MNSKASSESEHGQSRAGSEESISARPQQPIEYTGYEPRNRVDFGIAEEEDSEMDIVSHERDTSPGSSRLPESHHHINPEMVRDKAQSDHVSILCAVLSTIVLVVCVVFLVTRRECAGNTCSKVDVSSMESSNSPFSTFSFQVPTQHVLGALATSALGMLMSSVYTFLVIRSEVGSDYMVQIAGSIREGAVSFLIQEYVIVSFVLIPIFILGGLASNWRLAACYFFGALLSAATGWIGMLVATRGSIRTAAAAQDSLTNGLKLAFRTGSVVGLSVVSFGLAGVSICYLVFRDIHALAGFSAGASTIALFSRVGGGIFTKAADVGADLVAKVEANIPEDDPRNPATIADNVGDNVGDIAGMGADLFESYVGSIIASASLGVSLPYFQENTYAMCVHNHLYVDLACLQFGSALNKISLAHSICRASKRYEGYNELSFFQSNSLFIAVPFLLGLVGVIASIICTLLIHVPGTISTDTRDGRTETMKKLLRSVRANFILSAVIFAVGAAGICWGLFGANSDFQAGIRNEGNSGIVGYSRYQLLEEGTANRCTSRNLLIDGDPSSWPRGSFESLPYQPLDSFGSPVPSADQVPWRLFSCAMLGVLLGIVVSFLTEYFTAGSYSPTQGIASPGQYGAGSVIIQGLGIGFISTVIPLFLIVSSILGAHELFGPFGVGVSAVGMLSTLGVTMTMAAYGPVVDNAGGIAEMAGLPSSVRQRTDSLDALGNTTAATGKGFSNGSAILTAYALLATLTQNSGLIPNPRELVGTSDSTRIANHITSRELIGIIDVNVIAGTFAGVVLPYVFGGFTILAVSRSARVLIAEVRRQFREIPGLRVGAPGVMPNHKLCVSLAAREAIYEMMIPGIIGIMAPLIVGFGLGQKALVGLLLGAIGSGYMLGVLMSNTGASWDNAKKLVESGFFGDDNSRGSKWHHAVVAGDTVGDPFKDTSGPAMNILIKLMVSFSIVAISQMRPDRTRGWIGLILLLLTLAIIGILMAMGYRRYGRLQLFAGISPAATSRACDDEQATGTISTRSPFYEAGPALSTERLVPGSQLQNEYTALANTEELQRPHSGVLDFPAYAHAHAD